MIETPKVSIVIPVYNAGKFLRSCLDSVCGQTLVDIEIICVLDCPSDGSDLIVLEYARKDERIKVISNLENMHIGCSRNVALDAAVGEYIAFCDHDDTMESDFLATAYSIAEKSHSVIVGSFDSYIEESDSEDFEFHKVRDAFTDLISGELTLHNPPVWTYLYKRAFLEEHSIRFVDTRLCSVEDLIFNCNVMSNILECDFDAEYPILKSHFYHHGIEHTNGSYGHRSMTKILNSCEAIGKCCRIAGENDMIDVSYAKGIVRFLYNSMWKEIEHNGLNYAFTQLGQIRSFNDVADAVSNNIKFYDRDLTLPKNFFLLLVKYIIRHRSDRP